MNAIDFIDNLISNDNIYDADLRYCLIDKNKVPFKQTGDIVKPNCKEDFVALDTLISDNIDKYAGVGVSIQASNIFAIDVDHCFSKPFDLESGDERALDIIEIFKDDFYIEFSFSGTGLRILFKADININKERFDSKFYTKNFKTKCEFYWPGGSNRYVTITGKTICNNNILLDLHISVLKRVLSFLNKYMLREKMLNFDSNTNVKNEDFKESSKKLLHYLLVDIDFQDLWFSKAPGSGKDESERDYHIVKYIYNKVTTNKDVIKRLFELSPFYESKDWKHKYKWNQTNFRYYNYIYEQVMKGR